MRKLFLPLLLLISANLAWAQEDMTSLDSPVVHLGYLEAVNGLPFNKTMAFLRTEDTPKMVDVIFNYTQTEMICEDRVPDGGGGWGGSFYYWGRVNRNNNEKHDWDWGHHHGYDRNWMGICRHWTTMETQKSARTRLIFKKAMHNDTGDVIMLNISQRDLHSTVFWVKGWATDPKDYYEVINLERTVVFK